MFYCVRVGERCNRLFYGECVFDAEDAASAALERVEVGAAAEGFAEVAGECADIGSFAAGHPQHGTWKPQCRIIRNIYPS